MTLGVLGLGVTGRAVVEAARRRGLDVVAADDALDRTDESHGQVAVRTPQLLERLDDLCALVVSPGIPDRHPVFEALAGTDTPVIDELDLAQRWDPRPRLAVTGTNGKTTVCVWVAEMLRRSGIDAVLGGNTEVPLVRAIDDPAPAVFVVEASSFRLGHARTFAPEVATWLNFAPDHLDVHASLDRYERAKAAIWAHAGPETIVIANAGDEVVMDHLPGEGRIETFGGPDSPHRVDGESVIVGDRRICAVDDLDRALPHDLENALAAAATARAWGAADDAIVSVLAAPPALAHRVQRIAEHAGVDYYDDSKATVPQATIAAVGGFESVVLIVGGRNKGLDLGPLAGIASRLRAAIAIGESAAEVASILEAAGVDVTIAGDMPTAVAEAAGRARRGDAVLLSPACASFDWFDDYHARGEAYVEAVHDHIDHLAGRRHRR